MYDGFMYMREIIGFWLGVIWCLLYYITWPFWILPYKLVYHFKHRNDPWYRIRKFVT